MLSQIVAIKTIDFLCSQSQGNSWGEHFVKHYDVYI